MARHQGTVPADLAALRALPGIGAYTARAVLVFAFERHEAVVDVNVARVLARAVAGAPLSLGAAQTLADTLVPPGRAWVWNQALMEIGAEVCRARVPACDRCPLAPTCVWFNAGRRRARPGAGALAPEPFRGL